MLNFSWFDNLVAYFRFVQSALNNENIFFVWWIIRDILLNIKTEKFEDIDIALSWSPEEVFVKLDKSSWSIFKTDKFWTITIVDKNNNCQYEITPFREEWIYSDVRHPDELKWTNSLLKDSIRRDFTINCIYYTYQEYRKLKNNMWLYLEPFKIDDLNKNKFMKFLKNNWFILISPNILIIQEKKLIDKITKDWKINQDEIVNLIWGFEYLHIIFDPHWWVNDILNQKIKAVGNPDDRINEDALRIIRWIRFVSILNQYENINFDFDSKTWLSMKKYYFLIRKIAKERIIQEMKKVFKNWNAFGFISLMDELNILKYFFPALKNCKHYDQPTRYHPFDIYSHNLLSLYHLQKINSNYLVRFGMLYHDIWKVDQYYWTSIKKDEESQRELYKLEICHTIIWAEITEKEFKNLWFSKKEVEEIVFYVKYHMYPGELLNMWKNKQIREIKKFISQYWIKKLLNLCDITIWDRLGQYNPLQHSDIQWVIDLKNKINKIYEETWRITLKDLKINWNDIVKLLWQPWPKVWKLLNCLLEFVLEDESRNNRKILLNKAKQLIN